MPGFNPEFRPASFIKEVPSSGRTVVNLGDATLLTSLQDVAGGANVIALDPNKELMQLIVRDLAREQPVGGFFRLYQEQMISYSTIAEIVNDHSELNRRMQRAYRDAWLGAAKHLDRLTILPIWMDEALDELNGTSLPIADEVNYHYPSPQTNPRFEALQLAARILKPNGIFTLTTENSQVMSDFITFGGNCVRRHGWMQRENPNQFASAYDVYWGNDGFYRVIIGSEGGKLAERLNKLETSWFYALLARWKIF